MGSKLDGAAVFREGNYSSKMLSDICEPSEVTPAEHVPSHLGPASSATVLIDPSRSPKDRALAQPMHQQLEGSLRTLTGFICCSEEAKCLGRTVTLMEASVTASGDVGRVGFPGKTLESCTLDVGVFKVNDVTAVANIRV